MVHAGSVDGKKPHLKPMHVEMCIRCHIGLGSHMAEGRETAVDCGTGSAIQVRDDRCQYCEAVCWEESPGCNGVEMQSDKVHSLCRCQHQLVLVDADTQRRQQRAKGKDHRGDFPL